MDVAELKSAKDYRLEKLAGHAAVLRARRCGTPRPSSTRIGTG